MIKEWISTVFILPLSILVFIPFIVLYITGYEFKLNNAYLLTIGIFLLLGGFTLAIITTRLFASLGKGTAAPWNPPKNLVIAGPYRYVRNPMLTSVFIMQIAEILIFNSTEIFWIFITFLILNMFYFPLVEEKKLECRFGKDYIEYKRNVPRYIPRLIAWQPNKNK
jgi:protein-S-isoprenylcysteine O-methyltransferase Ste14